MTFPPTGTGTRVARPLRLWPAVLIVALQTIIAFCVPLLLPDAGIVPVLAGVVGGAAVLVWWLFFSRAEWTERVGVVAFIVAVMAVTPRILDASLATGMMGFLFFIYAIPVVSLLFVLAVAGGRRMSVGPRRALVAAAILFACGMWAFLRTNGIRGDGTAEFAWRWSPTHEEQLLASNGGQLPAAPNPAEQPVARPSQQPAAKVTDEPVMRAPAAVPETESVLETPVEWPGFRGPHRDGIVRGVRIETDWNTSALTAL
ncbi:MAG TPA: hypothetical protein VES20_01960, partial [Bryobacteraceae bacterium]|nr:hypothetical protein [Bryobacteraceae bacterium]